ncbi:hypothetical protein TREVI0001_1426 [Treponema vincentii ATCC 35580]|uniref:Uncharacterized protein n=1 Tax=Treponema vincentii ATCC 35580 TaxID=596324 RepID=C8PPW5_9SPIR|nr:hypothetical protein [Treponema vincentii]EEV20565.1 hypothetical protein TREVI0001_1426 [Treponema vincentii ATCC 35580]
MRKPKTIISIFWIIVLAVICGMHAVAQEYGIVDDRIMDFYKTKDYQKAPELLESFFNEHHPDREASWYYPTVFFFSKIFPTEQSFNQLMTIYGKSDSEERRFLILVFSLKDKQLLNKLYEKENDAYLKGFIKGIIDDKTKYDPLTADITNSTELDILWSIFFATGDSAPIRKIASVLAWEDIFKHKITTFTGTKEQKKELIKLLSDFDIKYNNEEPDSPMGDCGISVLDNRTMPSENVKKLVKMLNITGEEAYRTAIKYSAFWSLAANLNRHPLVRTECMKIADDKAAPERNLILFILVKSVMY